MNLNLLQPTDKLLSITTVVNIHKVQGTVNGGVELNLVGLGVSVGEFL